MNLRDITNRLTGAFGYSLVKEFEIEDLLSILRAHAIPNISNREMPIAEAVVFSKDRALQLHALLSSYFEQVKNFAPVHLFYDSSSVEHQKSYHELIELFGDRIATINSGTPFRDKLIDILYSIGAPKVFFLVDDDLFIDKIDMLDLCKFDSSIFVPSLRLGQNLTYNYIYNKNQPLPPFHNEVIDDNKFLCWKWSEGSLDWRYIFSVDGNLFSSNEIRAMAARIQFNAPNSFEYALLRFWWAFQFRYGIAYHKARIVNIPCNRVQTEVDNIKGNVHQDFLLEQWNKGMQMDYRSLYGKINISAHQDLEYGFTKRI